MANLAKWTAAAREAESHSVIVAVPAQSHEAGFYEAGFEIGAGTIGEAVAGGVLMSIAGVHHGINRFRSRRKALGKRNHRDRVAILFYDDRVDLHNRRPLLKKVGSHVESHPLSDVERPDAMTLRIADVTWYHSQIGKDELETKLAEHGIELAIGDLDDYDEGTFGS